MLVEKFLRETSKRSVRRLYFYLRAQYIKRGAFLLDYDKLHDVCGTSDDAVVAHMLMWLQANNIIVMVGAREVVEVNNYIYFARSHFFAL